MKYIGENKSIKFSPTLCKYFIIVEIGDISSNLYEQHFYTSIGRISLHLGDSPYECMIFCEFDVFHNVIHSN